MSSTPLGILISGRGSNMQAIVRACEEGRLEARVAVVVANVEDAGGLAWARGRGLSVQVIPHRSFRRREDHDAAIVAALAAAGVEWVCLAGYMRLLSAVLVEAYPNRIVNIHPSLLPAFPGLHAQRQAVAHGVKISGCTVHLVDLELDHGPIVLQRAVPVLDQDDEDSLAGRILVEEHQAYVEALALLTSGAWLIDGRRVVMPGAQLRTPPNNH